MAGLAFYAFTFTGFTIYDGLLMNTVWHAVDYCGELPAVPHSFWAIKKGIVFVCGLVKVLFCNGIWLGASIICIVLATTLPALGIVAYRIKDVLPHPIKPVVQRLIPDIRESPALMLSVLGMVCGAGSGTLVWLFMGAWRLWTVLWTIWIGTFVVLFEGAEVWGPKIMPNGKAQIALGIVLVFCAPLIMTVLPFRLYTLP